MAEPIRVAFVDHTARLGGAEWALLRLLERLDPDVVAATVVLGEEGPLAERVRELELPLVIAPLDARVGHRRKEKLDARGLVSPRPLALAGATAARLARTLRERGIQIVHTNTLKAHVLGGVAGRLAGARVVWHVRDHLDSPYLPRAAVLAMRTLARTVPHRIVAVSQSVAEKVGGSNALVQHQGVPLPKLNGHGADRQRERYRIGLVGRIAPWKGQHVFLAAAGRLAPRFPEAEFVLAGAPLFGEEEYERELRRQSECALLAGRVRFLGFIEDVWSVYHDLDVAVHASVQPEPYGNVVLEAMASRVPIVATAGGGVSDLVDHGRTGLIVPPGDAAALAAAIERLLHDDAERARLGAAGRAHVEEHFSLDEDARRIERLYRELVR